MSRPLAHSAAAAALKSRTLATDPLLAARAPSGHFPERRLLSRQSVPLHSGSALLIRLARHESSTSSHGWHKPSSGLGIFAAPVRAASRASGRR